MQPTPSNGHGTKTGRRVSATASKKLLEALIEVPPEAATKGKAKAVAEDSGEDRSIAWEAAQVRDMGIGFLRKERALRVDVSDYLERRDSEGRSAIDALRLKLEKTRADIQSKLVAIGFDDPTNAKLSPCRVLPGDVERHPLVVAARNALQAASNMAREKVIAANRWEIEELRRLIRMEGARLAGL